MHSKKLTIHPKSYYKLLKILKSNTSKLLEKINIEATNIKILSGGYSSNVNLHITSSNKDYFVKVAREESLANEVYWHKIAEEHSISTPRLLSYDLSMKHFPFTYEVLEYVKGLHPYNISNTNLYKSGYFAGKELAKMHEIKVGGFGYVDEKFKWRYKNWFDVLENERKQVNDSLALRLLTQKEIDTIDEVTIYNKQLKIRTPCLVHGDLWEGNILFLPKSQNFVILDPLLIGGDPMFDIAYSTVPRTKPYEKAVIEGYSELHEITEKESYRLRMLKIFCIFREAVDYELRNDARYKINRLVKSLRYEMST